MKAANTKKQTFKSVRLSKKITPLKYKIHFEPNLDEFTFSGEEEIELEIKKPTKVIRMHSAEIEILEIELLQNKKSQTGKVVYKEKDEEVIFTFENPIKKGRAVLKLSFAGILNDKMRGFYRSKYLHDGKEKYMGVTQFESTDARRAFPSFDEPAHKATFEVSFKVPRDRTVISNTIESEIVEHRGGYKVVHFEPSPKMSSYLLAFIIGHFEYIESKTNDGIIVRVFVTNGKKKQAEFALTVAVKTLEFYTEYFKIKYPLPTLDLVAIPDFAAGAMENWGAVTYRETALLVDPENSSTHTKQRVALVIAHELAHQWFGNLVTMEWWTHLWLNEGFASYIEYLALNHLYPKWKVWTQFVYIDQSTALELDGLKSTHPIEVDVNHPAEISEIFDEVSYSKGASIIRMLADFLGEKEFRNGLRAYLKKYSYSNAKTEDLWDSFEKVSKKPVKKMMKNWIGEGGYPLISVEMKKNRIELSQKRFFSSVFSQETKDNTIWLTPISIVSSKSKTEDLLLEEKSASMSHDSSEWIKINKNETSFHRTKYSKQLLGLLETSIKQKKLSEEDRFGVIRDAFVLSEAGYSSTDQALSLAFSYKRDDSYIVWAQIATEAYKLNNLLSEEAFYEEFKMYVLSLFETIYEKLGWEKKKGEDHSTTLLRGIVIGVMGRFGNKDVIKKAIQMFQLDKSGKRKIDSDLRGTVYVLVAENGSEKEFEMFLGMYKKATFQEEQDRILRALCSFKNDKLLARTLNFSFSDQVRAQDSFKAVGMVWSNTKGRDIAWSKVKKEWNNIVKKYSGGHLFSRFIKPAANFASDKDAKDIEQFFKTRESKGLDRTIQQVLEQIHSNAAWIKRDKKKIQNFLKNEY